MRSLCSAYDKAVILVIVGAEMEMGRRLLQYVTKIEYLPPAFDTRSYP
jgi:hypothetical protein